ncbi:MAG: outer membrane protein transport protein [Paracoccaceae bacterium]
MRLHQSFTSMALTSTMAVLGSAAFAGGLDRSYQDISIIFQDGNYAEFSYGVVMPSVSGVGANATMTGPGASGDMASTYSSLSFGLRQQLTENIGIAVIFDEPFGANASYDPTADYFLAGTYVTVNTTATTLLAQYQITPRISLIGGLRHQTITGDVAVLAFGGMGGDYAMTATNSGTFGYVAGVAYEIPAIALRASLVYNSVITHTMEAREGSSAGTVPSLDFDVTMPQSIAFNLQTGIAANTLLTASVRWSEWSVFDVTPAGYAAANGGASLVDYTDDVMTYSLGVGRKFTDSFSGSLTLTYEPGAAGTVSDLTPTNGKFGVTVGGRYSLASGVTITGGVNYTWLGDATTHNGASFSGNSALGVGVKIGYAF